MVTMEHSIHTMPVDQLDLLISQATAAAARESAALRQPVTAVEPLAADLGTRIAKQPSGNQSVATEPSTD